MSYIKNSFNLAETLIVLTIIGVVAVLTITNLMKNYQAAQLKSGFLAANSIVKNTSAALIHDGVHIFDLSPEEIAQYFNGKNLKKYPAVNYRSFRNEYSTCQAVATHVRARFDMLNGMTGLIIYNNYNNSEYGRLIGIDVNGEAKKPNRYGHDVFFWYQKKESGQFEITGSITANKDLNHFNKLCNMNNDTNAAENGVGCGTKALIDPNWFKNLPR